MLALVALAASSGWLAHAPARALAGSSAHLRHPHCLLFDEQRLFLESTSEGVAAPGTAFGSGLRSPSPAPTDSYADFFSPLRAPPSQLRASDLDEVLQPDHMDRLRFSNSPLQAYGALFRWDALFTDDMFELNKRAWVEIADRHGMPHPDDDDVQRAMGMRVERAITQVFRWTDDWGQTRGIAYDFYELYARIFREHTFEAARGSKGWLELLNEYRVPCALCSRLDKFSTEHACESAGLSHLFQAMVSAEDDVQTLEETFLVAFVKLGRPPSRCVVFDNEPQGVTAAHDVLAKSVALVGKHPGYELKHAEKRLFDMDEMTLMSLREVFSDDSVR